MGAGREETAVEIQQTIEQICRLFRIEGDFLRAEQIKNGNINQTYKVTFLIPEGYEKSFLVQRVNTYVFRQPENLMDNADRVSEHIRAKNQGRIALHYHHTSQRKTYAYDQQGGFWRMSNYIPSVTYNASSDPAVLREAGAAFGAFQRDLADFPADELYETIPDFHNTPKRLQALFDHVEEDPVGRVAQVREELDYIARVREKAERLTRLWEQGQLPLRVTHNDTKINNVLFDQQGKHAMVVIDLDTVMPGLVGHDFGDGVRFCTNVVEEDCPDSERACCDLERFRAFAQGFLEQTGEALTPLERETLALSAFALTVELAARFLDDYIMGDVYFKLNYPQHNLVRTRCQLALARDMESKLEQMQAIVDACMQAQEKE